MARKPETELDKARKKLEAALTEKYQQSQGILRQGDKMILPENLTVPEAIRTLEDWWESQEEEENTYAEFDAHPNDGLVSFYRAMTETYGTLSGASIMTFFGKIPGQTIDVDIDFGQSVTVPVGNAQVPGLPIEMRINPDFDSDYEVGGRLQIQFTHKRKYKPLIEEIIALTRNKLRTQSIFKGKALNDNFEFIDVEGFDPSRVVYATKTEKVIRANLYEPIIHTERWKKAGNPLKRGVLLYGPYGTGKTLTALSIAKLAKDNEWTFINVRPGGDVSRALKVARRYAPAVVFFEDIDQETGAERNGAVNNILNTVDGLLGKSDEVMVVLTTNHIEKISKGMIRPGRLDAVIKLDSLDGPAAVRLFNLMAQDPNGRSLLEGKFDPQEVEKSVEGLPPAFLVEAVVKSKAYSMVRTDSDKANIRWEDLEAALTELRPQFELMQGEQVTTKTTIDTLIKQHVYDSSIGDDRFVELVAEGVRRWRKQS